ncbi:MAG: hypothetical protein ACI93T_000216 [Porticoccaceae bacterium]|jgi:hypothetical protein
MTRELSCSEYNCVESPEAGHRRRSPDELLKAATAVRFQKHAALKIASTRGLESRSND